MELQFVHYSEDENNSPAQLVKMNTAWFLFLTLELSFSQYNSCYFLSLELFVNLLSLITIYTECFDVQSFAVLSLTLWEHGIPAEKADIASQGNIPILFDLKHHDCLCQPASGHLGDSSIKGFFNSSIMQTQVQWQSISFEIINIQINYLFFSKTN